MVSASVPQRTIVIRADQRGPSELSAWISANCHLVGGEKQVCSEEISIVAGAELEHRLGETQPIGAVFGRDRHDLAENLQAAADIVALEGGVGLAAKRGSGFAHRPCVGLLARVGLDSRY